jgi:hypothetical protein
MKIAQTTIIPIELYTYELRKYIEIIFLDKGILKYFPPDDSIVGICRELLPDETKLYYLNLHSSNVKVIFFIEAGMILLMENIFNIDFQNKQLDDINKILKNRRQIHLEVIEERDIIIDMIKKFSAEFNKIKKIGRQEFFKIKIHY